MALQGTIDAFPLTDVLQLLSSASKSGRLLLEGDRGRAELWIEEGSVVGGDAGAVTSGAAQLVFELLRFDDGSFVFDVADGVPPVAVEPAALVECVGAASELLEEWVRIESVVPSMQHGVTIAAELDGESVSLEPRMIGGSSPQRRALQRRRARGAPRSGRVRRRSGPRTARGALAAGGERTPCRPTAVVE